MGLYLRKIEGDKINRIKSNTFDQDDVQYDFLLFNKVCYGIIVMKNV